ncbi:MAG TPA: DsbA family protein [Aliidongia sp.]|uniref:DsbA family protein n=1 Tax=Aliidongia sp. TaxID=1914230 RepID=UPI002DDCF6D7|nr:DsbA family protein [Aliidongia sp.]HEV2674394.1 DsbA family protein [Aliidongia sp.]
MFMSFRRSLLLLPILALALFPLRSQAADGLTPAQTDQVNKLIHDYFMNNPKALIDAIEHAEASMKQEEQSEAKTALQSHREELDHDPTSPVLGNAKGDVTIVEFFDYRCPYCKVTAPTLQTLIAQDPKVRVVMKEFPILGKESVFASRVALVAKKHGKYAEFHQAMFALKTKVDDAQTLEVAKSIGLDPAQVKKEAESSDIDAILKNNYDLAKALNVSGTPAFVIGDTLLPGAVELKDFQDAVAAARKG